MSQSPSTHSELRLYQPCNLMPCQRHKNLLAFYWLVPCACKELKDIITRKTWYGKMTSSCDRWRNSYQSLISNVCRHDSQYKSSLEFIAPTKLYSCRVYHSVTYRHALKCQKQHYATQFGSQTWWIIEHNISHSSKNKWNQTLTNDDESRPWDLDLKRSHVPSPHNML